MTGKQKKNIGLAWGMVLCPFCEVPQWPGQSATILQQVHGFRAGNLVAMTDAQIVSLGCVAAMSAADDPQLRKWMRDLIDYGTIIPNGQSKV